MMETESAAKSLPAIGPLKIKIRGEHYDQTWDIPFTPPIATSEPPKLPVPHSKYHLLISESEPKDFITVHQSPFKAGDAGPPLSSENSVKTLNFSSLINYNKLNSALGIQNKVHGSLDSKEFINPFATLKDLEELKAFSKSQKDLVSKSVPTSPNHSPATSPKLIRHSSTLNLSSFSQFTTLPPKLPTSPLATVHESERPARWFTFNQDRQNDNSGLKDSEAKMHQFKNEKSKQTQVKRKRCLISNADINAFAPTSM